MPRECLRYRTECKCGCEMWQEGQIKFLPLGVFMCPGSPNAQGKRTEPQWATCAPNLSSPKPLLMLKVHVFLSPVLLQSAEGLPHMDRHQQLYEAYSSTHTKWKELLLGLYKVQEQRNNFSNGNQSTGLNRPDCRYPNIDTMGPP